MKHHADGNLASASVVSELVSERKRLDHEQSVTYIQTEADASAAQPLPLSWINTQPSSSSTVTPLMRAPLTRRAN